MTEGFRALLSYWVRNPWQLATLLAGLALSTALWSGVQAINAEARASYAQASDVVGTADVARVLRRDGAAFSPTHCIFRRSAWFFFSHTPFACLSRTKKWRPDRAG